MLPVPQCEMHNARAEVIQKNEGNDYQEYFNYVMSECELSFPDNWQDALVLYSVLLQYAENGA